MGIFNPNKTIGALIERVADQAIADSSNVLISFDTATQNPDDLWDIADPTKIIFPVNNWFTVSGAINYKSTTAADYYVRFLLNGVVVRDFIAPVVSVGTAYSSVPFSLNRKFSMGDYIQLQARQLSGAAKQVNAFLSVKS